MQIHSLKTMTLGSAVLLAACSIRDATLNRCAPDGCSGASGAPSVAGAGGASGATSEDAVSTAGERGPTAGSVGTPETAGRSGAGAGGAAGAGDEAALERTARLQVARATEAMGAAVATQASPAAGTRVRQGQLGERAPVAASVAPPGA